MNPFAVQQSLLRERLNHFLCTVHPVLQTDIIRALKEPGKLLAQPDTEIDSLRPIFPAGAWSLLTFLVAQHIRSEVDILCASSVAVAVECFICALDLLDDIEDDDQTPIVQALGPARLLNVSTALLMLAQRAILSLLQQGVDPMLVTRLLDALQEIALTATVGQHQDLMAEQSALQDFTHEECLKMAQNKAGSLMRLPCWLGALCAGASDEECRLFLELGELLGIAHQLDNDCHDLYHLLSQESSTLSSSNTSFGMVGMSVKSDLIRGKKTLPIVLAARKNHVLHQAQSLASEQSKEKYLHALHEGILAAWGMCLLYRERAKESLQKIESLRPISSTLCLLLNLT